MFKKKTINKSTPEHKHCILIDGGMLWYCKSSVSMDMKPYAFFKSIYNLTQLYNHNYLKGKTLRKQWALGRRKKPVLSVPLCSYIGNTLCINFYSGKVNFMKRKNPIDRTELLLEANLWYQIACSFPPN